MLLVLFDLDDTLLDHTGALERASRAFHRRWGAALSELDEDAFVAQWWQMSEVYMDRFLRGEISYHGARRARIRDLLGSQRDDAECDAIYGRFLQDYEAGWRLFDDVLPTLEALGQLRLGGITNGDDGTQRRKAAAVGLSLDPLVTAGGFGHPKPDPRIFAEACRLAGAPTRRSVYVGDKPDTDADAARAAGLRGVWLRRPELGHLPPSAQAPPGVEVIESLAELPGLLLR